jgi:hypothetical protein
MPPTEILVFREANGRIPLVDWLDDLPAKARAKCLNYMRLLATSGHELRRPAADFLRMESMNCVLPTGPSSTAFCISSTAGTSWFFRTASPRAKKFLLLKSSAPSRANNL